MQGNNNYYSNDKSKCPDSVRFAGKEKYSNKVMVWVAKSNRDTSNRDTLFRPSKLRGSQFGHLYKRMLSETLASFHS